jgi:hypothetical protein
MQIYGVIADVQAIGDRFPLATIAAGQQATTSMAAYISCDPRVRRHTDHALATAACR